MVDLRVRYQVGKAREAPVCLQTFRSAHESRPSSERECTANADAADPECSDIADAESDVANDEEVEWFGMNGFHESLDFFGLLWTRSKEYIGTGKRIRLEPANRFAEGIRMANVVALGSCGQQYSAADRSIASRAALTRSTASDSS